MDRAADNHYPTSCLEIIASRPVQLIAANDCVLFLWATAPMLPEAFLVMGAWGFDYRSNYIWSKDRIGTGYWNRNAHEHLLVGVKGNIPAPAPGTQLPSVLEGKVTKHSAKPERFLEMIEGYFPTLPKIELNRRGPARSGWSAWGNESASESAAPSPTVYPGRRLQPRTAPNPPRKQRPCRDCPPQTISLARAYLFGRIGDPDALPLPHETTNRSRDCHREFTTANDYSGRNKTTAHSNRPCSRRGGSRPNSLRSASASTAKD